MSCVPICIYHYSYKSHLKIAVLKTIAMTMISWIHFIHVLRTSLDHGIAADKSIITTVWSLLPSLPSQAMCSSVRMRLHLSTSTLPL